MGAEELNIRIKAGVFSAGQLTALTTSQAQLPRDGYVLRSTIENHLCAINFVFGGDSYLHHAIEGVLAATNRYKQEFQSMTAENPD